VRHFDSADMRDAPFPDAGARGDPLVVRLHQRRQVGVGERRACALQP
jgi:hypothetical protein